MLRDIYRDSKEDISNMIVYMVPFVGLVWLGYIDGLV